MTASLSTSTPTAPLTTAPAPLSAIAASMVIGAVALMILGVQPVLLGALVEEHRLTDAQLGPLATVEVLALAIGSGIGPSWLGAGRMRLKAVGLSLGLAVITLASCLAPSALALDALRAAAGLIEGLLMGPSIVYTIQHRHPDRLNAIFLAAATAPQVLLAYLLPIWIVPRFGTAGAFTVLAILSLASAGCALLLTKSAKADTAETIGKPQWTWKVFLALGAIVLQLAAIGGAWNYIALLSDQRHFPPSVAGLAVSGGLIFQVIGALAVAMWSSRLNHRLALVFATACQAGVICLLSLAHTAVPFLGAAFTFGLFWLAVSPFQIRLLIDFDPTRRAAMILTAVTLVGLSIGPTIAAAGVRGQDVSGAYWICGGLMAVGAALYSALGIGARRPRITP